MDKYNLRISVAGDYNIIDFFNKAEKLDRLEVSFSKANVLNSKSYKFSDVIIIDLATPKDDIELIYANKAKYAVVVFICEHNNFSKLTQFRADEIFDIWTKENDILLQYKVSQFLYRMRDYLDAELSKNQLETLIDSVPDLIWFKDVIGSHIKVNNSFCQTVNKTKEQIKYRGHCYIWDLDISEYEQGEYGCYRRARNIPVWWKG